MRTKTGDHGLLLALMCVWALPAHAGSMEIIHYDANITFDIQNNAAQTQVRCTLRNDGDEPCSMLRFDIFAREQRCKVRATVDEIQHRTNAAAVPVPFRIEGHSSGTKLVHVTPASRIMPGTVTEIVLNYSWQATDPTNVRDNYRPFATLPDGTREVCLLSDFAWLPVLRDDSHEISETARTQRFRRSVKPSWDLRMDVPEDYVAVLLAGKLVRQEQRGGRVVSHWRSIVPRYPQAMVGRFEKKIVRGPSTHVTFYLPSGWSSPLLERIGKDLGGAYDVYAGLFGPLEGEEIRVCVSSAGQGGHGGYLSFTMDTRMVGGQINEQNLPMVMEMMAHELAHSWWGWSVTSYGRGTKFLRESLANFATQYLIEQTTGQDRFGAELAKLFWQGLHRDVICAAEGDSERAAYLKGPVVLNVLRQEMGDERFFAVLRHFAQTHRGGHATMSDFIAACNDRTGQDWTPFFEDFCFSDAVPDYRVVRFESSRDGQRWKTEVQLQNAGRGTLTCPLDLQMADAAQRESFRVATGKTEQLTFVTPDRVRAVVVDPDHRAFQGSGPECRLKMLGVGDVRMEWIWYWRGVVLA